MIPQIKILIYSVEHKVAQVLIQPVFHYTRQHISVSIPNNYIVIHLC
jgi:hypothetical protein